MSNILIIWTVQALNGIPLLVHLYAPDFTIISKVQEKIFPIKKNMTNPETFAMFSFTYTQNWTNLDLDNRSVLRQTPTGLTQMALQRKTIVRNTTIIVTTFNHCCNRGLASTQWFHDDGELEGKMSTAAVTQSGQWVVRPAWRQTTRSTWRASGRRCPRRRRPNWANFVAQQTMTARTMRLSSCIVHPDIRLCDTTQTSSRRSR